MSRAFPVSSLSFQDLAGAAERLMRRGVLFQDEDPARWIDAARDALVAPQFEAEPLHAFRRRIGNKVRFLTLAPPRDRLIAEALLPSLTEWVDRFVIYSLGKDDERRIGQSAYRVPK